MARRCPHCSQDIRPHLDRADLHRSVATPVVDEIELLSPHEAMVAVRVADGWTSARIARDLGVSEKTIKTQLTTIFVKLDLTGRVQLAVFVVRCGLVALVDRAAREDP